MQLQNYYFLQHNDKCCFNGWKFACNVRKCIVCTWKASSTRKQSSIFHSLTLSKYKMRGMDSFKSDSGYVRVVIATPALTMRVNFPDVLTSMYFTSKYIVHYGPARSLVDVLTTMYLKVHCSLWSSKVLSGLLSRGWKGRKEW